MANSLREVAEGRLDARVPIDEQAIGETAQLVRDFWFWTTLCIAALFAIFLVYPLFSLFASSFVDPDGGGFTLAHYAQFFKKRYYYRALLNSMSVTACVTVLAVLIGAPMAYLTSAFNIRGKRFIDVLIIVSMLSPPFIGAYSWILLGGRSGVLTTFLNEYLGIGMPTIYGFGGILLVLTLKLYPFIYLYVSGALKSIDVSLSEAAESLGCDPLRKVFTIVLPLITPTVLAGALLVFMNALADFGTPMLIGEGFVVMPVLIYSEFVSEMGGQANFAAALAAIMVVLTCLIFLGQKYVVNRKSFTMSALRPMKPTTLPPLPNALAHGFVYVLVFLSIVPQLTVVYTSFMKVNGVVFVPGFSLDSYRIIFDKLGTAITNTYVYGLAAIAIIVLLGMFIAYLATRRKNLVTSIIDTFTMFPYIIPGSVLGITLLLAFNKPPLVLSGTAMIIILAFVVRRLPGAVEPEQVPRPAPASTPPLPSPPCARPWACCRNDALGALTTFEDHYETLFHFLYPGIGPVAGPVTGHRTGGPRPWRIPRCRNGHSPAALCRYLRPV